MILERPIIFIFAGRKPFLEIQRTYWEVLKSLCPGLEVHLWDFSRNDKDHQYLIEISKKHSWVRLFDQFYGGPNSQLECSKAPGVLCNCVRCRPGLWSEPYKYYAQRKAEYASSVFLKLDDDIVYIETRGFLSFLNKINQSTRGGGG